MKLYIVVPCYNEEDVLPETSSRLQEKMQFLIHNQQISEDSHVVFVDDGSKDRTWAMIDELHHRNSLFSGIKLSKNRGHQNALLAGLSFAAEHADAAVSMDADLQDDINAIDGMIKNTMKVVISYMECEVREIKIHSSKSLRPKLL